ncbi:MAG: septum formation protein Maf [Sphingobacteriales bacterium]|jgi:septum formation protein|nr:MAG: septum formation protein Maf [Sphingobacteriales bacterium]
MTKIYLASKSPRRQELLSLMGLPFELFLKEVDESYPPNLALNEVAAFISAAKAKAYKPQPDGIILTADTVVIIDNQILGKPLNAQHAFEMLKKLSGNMHQVITAFSIVQQNQITTFSDTTEVYFKTLSNQQILHYVNTYKPFDKAGAYGIQEWMGLVAIEKIIGSYSNVMGLPTEKLYGVLQQLGIV